MLPSSDQEESLWASLCRHQGKVFHTAKGLTFTNEIRGNELFVNRKEKSITRATVNVTYREAQRLRKAGVVIDGPKRLGTFGASYLFPVFIFLGIIPANEQMMMDLPSLDAP